MPDFSEQIEAGEELARRGKLMGRDREILEEMKRRHSSIPEAALKKEPSTLDRVVSNSSEAFNSMERGIEATIPFMKPIGEGVATLGGMLKKPIVKASQELVQGGHDISGGVLGVAAEGIPTTKREAYAQIGLSGVNPMKAAVPFAEGLGKLGMKKLSDTLLMGVGPAAEKAVAGALKWLPGGSIPAIERETEAKILRGMAPLVKDLRQAENLRGSFSSQISKQHGATKGKDLVGEAISTGVEAYRKEGRAAVRKAWSTVVDDPLAKTKLEPQNLIEAKKTIQDALNIYAKGEGDPAVVTTLNQLEKLMSKRKQKELPLLFGPKGAELVRPPTPDVFDVVPTEVDKLVSLRSKLQKHAYATSSKGPTGEMNERGFHFKSLVDALDKDLEGAPKELLPKLAQAREVSKGHIQSFGNKTIQKILKTKDKQFIVDHVMSSPQNVAEFKSAVGDGSMLKILRANKSDDLMFKIRSSANPREAFDRLIKDYGNAEDFAATIGEDNYKTLSYFSDLEQNIPALKKQLEEQGAILVQGKRAGESGKTVKIKLRREEDESFGKKMLSRFPQTITGAMALWSGFTGHPILTGVFLAAGVAPEMAARRLVQDSAFRNLVGRAAVRMGTAEEKLYLGQIAKVVGGKKLADTFKLEKKDEPKIP